MSKIKVIDMQGADAAEMVIADEVMVLDKGAQAVKDAVVAHLARRRSGTACTKTKGEVAGTGAKPWRQKGTGRARAGYRQSPVWRGGAVVFGPRPRSYDKKVNRKVSRLAFKRALSEKINDGQIRVVEALELEAPKTKLLAQLLKGLGIERGCLVVVDSIDDNLACASRNVPRVEVIRASDVAVYELLRYPTLLATRKGMEQMIERLQQ